MQPAPEVPVPAAEPEPAFDRRGVLLVGGVGVTHCAQAWCSDSIVAGMGRLELGWRFNWIAPVVYVSGGGTPLSPPEGDVDGTMSILGSGVAVRIFPVTQGRFDPHLGFGLGYSRIAKKYDEDRGKDVIERGAAVFTGGLSIYLGKHLALGPRVDYTLPFAGKLCAEDSFGEGCTKASDINEDPDDAVQRANRRAWPRPWSVTLDLLVVF